MEQCTHFYKTALALWQGLSGGNLTGAGDAATVSGIIISIVEKYYAKQVFLPVASARCS